MKKRRRHNIAAIVMAVLMGITLIPSDVALLSVNAETTAATKATEVSTIAAEQTTVAQTSAVEQTTVAQTSAVESTTVGKTTETTKDVVFDATANVDDVEITVKADAGVFPEGAYLKASKVETSVKEKVEEKVEEVREADKKQVAASYTFDITIFDKNGNEIEPNTSKGSVKVSFALKEAKKNDLKAEVYHTEKTDDLKTEKLDTQKKTSEGEVVADAKEFSYYTVEFTYTTDKEYQYVLEGDSSVKLSTVLKAIKVVESDFDASKISEVTFTDASLVKIEKDADGKDYTVTALKAFTSTEKLVVKYDGVKYEVVVTDDASFYTYTESDDFAPGTMVTAKLSIDIKETLTGGTVYGDDTVIMIVPLQNMTYSADEKTIEGITFSGKVAGSSNPSPTNGATPTSGAALKITTVKAGKLKLFLGTASKTYYLVSGGATVKTGGSVPETLTFDLEAEKEYYFYLSGSKANIYGIQYSYDKEADYKKLTWAIGNNDLAADTTVTSSFTTDIGMIGYISWKYPDAKGGTKATKDPKLTYKKDGYSFGDGVTYYGYIQGNNNGATDSANVADGGYAEYGSYVEFTPEKDGKVTLALKASGSGTKYFTVAYKDGSAVKSVFSGASYAGDDSVKANKNQLVSVDVKKNITYRVAVTGGSKICLYGITFETGDAPVDWSLVTNPEITANELSTDKTTIKLTYSGKIGVTYAEKLNVEVKDATGNKLTTLISGKEGTTGTVEYKPTASGKYTFVPSLVRDGFETRTGEAYDVDFVLPLAKPEITAATSKGNGSVEVEWNAVPEATSYEVYCDGVLKGTTDKLKYMVTDLTVGTTYQFTVKAVRGADVSPVSAEKAETVKAEAHFTWKKVVYGVSTSTDTKNAGFVGDVETDGQVQVYSLNGKGKLVPDSCQDGLSFYYTEIPSSKNFTLTAKVKVDEWSYSNGQDGFGIMAADTIGQNGNTDPVWNNSYMAVASKVTYYYDNETYEVRNDSNGSKVDMKLGIGVYQRVGITQANLPEFKNTATSADAIAKYFTAKQYTLESTAAKQKLDAGAYNIIGNVAASSATPPQTIGDITEMILTIRKNNTGYFISYTDMEGNVATKKFYELGELEQIDKDTVYAGFFASRNAKATFSDVKLTLVDPANDDPKEERPITYIEPKIKLLSPTATGNSNYKAVVWANAAGTFEIEGVKTHVDAETQYSQDIQLKFGGANFLKLKFTPDAGYSPEKDTLLKSYDTIDFSQNIFLNPIGNFAEALYVAPNGSSTGAGTKTSPLDIYTATKYAQAGQQIILMEGTYLLDKTVKTSRGNDGNANAMIYMIADPEANSRPVLDFQGACQGIQASANYWYFQGFDVTHSQNGQKGVNLSGSNCVFDMVNFYHNGNTGLQISRESDADTREQWPSNNLILNCTSYGNADSGYEDADGFAAKLTCGEGNVFRGCIAYNNADDGWDLYAKTQTGSIGMVTLENCIAYGNGYLEDGTDAGNGNGFKMGGESLSGHHTIKNSIAFNNKAKGFDTNSCPDNRMINCTSFNNESYNIALYTNVAPKTDYEVNGFLSYRVGTNVDEQLKLNQTDESKVKGTSNYYWVDGSSKNSASVGVDASWFVSLDTYYDATTHRFSQMPVTRNEDGSINMNGLLQLTSACPSDTGARLEAIKSVKIEAFKPATSVGGNDDDTSDDSGNGSDAKPETNNNATPGSTDSNNGTTNNTVTITPSGLAVIGQNVAVTVPAGTVIKDVNGNVITSGQVFVKAIGEDATSAARLSDAMKAQGIAFTEGTGVKYYEVTFIDANGNPLTFEGTLNVSFTYPEGTNANDYEFKVLHLLKSGTVDVMDPTATAAGLTVSVTELSPFAVAYAKVESEGATKGLVSADTADVAPIVPLAAVLFACVGAFAYAYTSKKRSF